MADGEVRVAIDARGVFTITLARSEVRNAFNEALLDALLAALETARTTPEVRVVVLRGEGAVFCAGGDVRWMAQLGAAGHRESVQGARRIADVFVAITHCPKPVVCVVQGAAIGGGVGLVAASDIVIASSEAVFGLSEARLGLVPACVAPFLLAKVGASHARRLLLTGERISAEEGLRVGLIHYLVPPTESLEVALERRIRHMLLCSPNALSRAKRLLSELSPIEQSLFFEATLGHVSQVMAELWISPEGREGMQAYLQKQPPFWADVAVKEERKER
jgi:methylglutaconyl-CoA hydratase